MKNCDGREILKKTAYDVIVVGGGIAGISAAVAASRGGAKVLLMEKQINLGGLATVGLISWYEPLCDGHGRQMIAGIAEELIRLSIKYGFENLPACWGGEGKNAIHYDRFATRYSPTLFSLALDEYVRENGVDIRFDTLATVPVMDGSLCKGIIAESISGKEFYPAKYIVDATGDACISRQAGIPTVPGKNYLLYLCHDINEQSVYGYEKDRDLNKLRHWSSVGGDMNGKGHPEGIPYFYDVDSDMENEFLRIGKQMLFSKYKSQDKNSRDIMTLPSMPQFRTIRHIVGEAVFDGDKVGASCEDSIGACGDFRKAGRRFEIPYRCLYNKGFSNIITAGRIISADGDGWEIIRVIPVCALTGQAAGAAAAMALKSDCGFSDLNISRLQDYLQSNNVYLKQ